MTMSKQQAEDFEGFPVSSTHPKKFSRSELVDVPITHLPNMCRIPVWKCHSAPHNYVWIFNIKKCGPHHEWMLSKMKNRRLTAQKLLSIEDKSEVKTWYLGIKIWASDKPVGICLGTMGPWSPAALWEEVSDSAGTSSLYFSPSGLRPLSRLSHTHKAALCSQWSCWWWGLFILTSAASLLCRVDINCRIPSCTGDSQCMIYSYSHFCPTFAPHPSVLHQSTAQAASLVKSKANCSCGNHSVLPFGRGGCLPRGFQLWAPFAWINSSEGFSWSFYVNTLQNMFCAALSPAIKILAPEFGCRFYWCCMGYSRIQLSLSEIYWHGSVESNKTVFLISKPSRQDSRRNIGNKDAMARRFLPPLPLLLWKLWLKNIGGGVSSRAEPENLVCIIPLSLRNCWVKAFSRNEVSEIPLHYPREELLMTGFVRKTERVEHLEQSSMRNKVYCFASQQRKD